MTEVPQEPQQPDEPNAPDAPSDEEHRVIVVGPDGTPVGQVVGGVVVEPQPGEGDGEGTRSVAELVEHPAKVMRIGSMIKQLLDEVRASPLDEAARARLKQIHQRSVAELEDGLAPELIEELDRLSLPFSDEATPSEAELRIAQAQLVGWLEGLFHGIQTTLFAQQMAARAQLEEMRRRAIAPGPGGMPPGMVPGDEGETGPAGGPRRSASGPYL